MPKKSQFETNLVLFDDTKIEPIDRASLEQIWLDDSLHTAFKFFAMSKFAEENIAFLEEALEMKSKKEMLRIKKIYTDYIAPSSNMEVNLDNKLKIEIGEKIEGGNFDLSIFDKAIDELSGLIRNGMLNEFLSDYVSCGAVPPKTLTSGKKRVVIVGGGFLGAVAAMALDQMPRFEVVLIDTKEYFEYTPEVIPSMVNPNLTDRIKIHHTSIVKNGHVHIGSIDQVTKEYLVAGNQKFPFHYAIFATGSSYTSHFKGYNLSTSYRTKRIALEFRELQAAERILVIGGGSVGIGIATEIASTFPRKKITMVEASDALIKRTPIKAQEIAIAECQKLGIEVILGERVLDLNQYHNVFETNKGRKLYFDKVFIATGPVPNSSFLEKHYPQVLDNRKQVKINYSLQIEGEENMFSGGDVSNLPFEKLAYNATIQGIAIARNICRLEKRKRVAVLGTKGLPKPRSIQHSQVIGFGLHNAMLIIREKFVFFGPKYREYKDSVSNELLSFYSQTKSPASILGKFPKPLPIGGSS